MSDMIRRIEIFVSLPKEYSKKYTDIKNNSISLNVALTNNELILHEVFVHKEKRGKGYWTNFIPLLEQFVISHKLKLKIQSVLNRNFMINILKRKQWKNYPNELSVMFAYNR